MSKYTTIQGDMWDSIAHKVLGDVCHTDKLMQKNTKYLDYFIFPAGIVLELPEVSSESSLPLPPWKKV